jgi:hypothetical protein
VLDNHKSIGNFFPGCVISVLNFSAFSRWPHIDPSPKKLRDDLELFYVISSFKKHLGTGVNVWSLRKCGKCKYKNHATFKKIAYTYVVIEPFSSTLSSISQALMKHFWSIFKEHLKLRCNLKWVIMSVRNTLAFMKHF